MQSFSDRETIQHQYDILAKKLLKGEAKSHLRELAKRAEKEIAFSNMSKSELEKLCTVDEYASDYFDFKVYGYDVTVKHDLLGEALETLPKHKCDVVLLSYFLDMSDEEIGRLLNVVRSTIFRHRKNALKKIKQYMEGKSNDEHK